MTQYVGQFATTEAGDVPAGLNAARVALLELVSGSNDDVADCLNDDLPASYRAIMASVRECRAALDSIEANAHEEIERTANWHRQCLADIESLNLKDA